MKKLKMLLLTATMAIAVTACGAKESETASEVESETVSGVESETYTAFSWPDNDVAKLLPIPESNIGKIDWENSDGFVIYVANTPKEDYEFYVNSCKEKEFDVKYRSGDDYYDAYHADGYHIRINYEGNDIMFIRANKSDEKIEEEPLPIDEENISETEVTETKSIETETSAQENGDISPDFKEAMDSYEAFFDEYCKFIKKYSETDDTTGMLADYADYMTKYADTMEKMNAIDQDELSTSEAAYYVEVTTRIAQKLAEVAQ